MYSTTLIALFSVTTVTAITCPESQPEIACNRCWETFDQAQSSPNCRVCRFNSDCGIFEFCGLDTNDNGCGTLRVCKPASRLGESCKRFAADQPRCLRQECGFNLVCDSEDFTQPDGTCTYINNNTPTPCVTGRCGRLIEHQSSGPSDDGCNTCFCDNGVLSCTEKACLGEAPPCEPLKEGDVCSVSPSAFIPSVSRGKDCPSKTACLPASRSSPSAFILACLPVCFNDSDCESGEYCRFRSGRGGCTPFGQCAAPIKEGEFCFFSTEECPVARCAEGLVCEGSSCVKAQ